MHTPFVVVDVSVPLSDKVEICEIFKVINFKLSFTNQSCNLRNFISKRRIYLKLNENKLVLVLRQFIA